MFATLHQLSHALEFEGRAFDSLAMWSAVEKFVREGQNCVCLHGSCQYECPRRFLRFVQKAHSQEWLCYHTILGLSDWRWRAESWLTAGWELASKYKLDLCGCCPGAEMV
jgi:hypothetical protein